MIESGKNGWDGVPLMKLAKEAGLPYMVVWQRVRRLGWGLERALQERVGDRVIKAPGPVGEPMVIKEDAI